MYPGALIPKGEIIADLISRVGGPTSVKALGLTVEEQEMAKHYGHYLRNRFTVSKLMRMLYPANEVQH